MTSFIKNKIPTSLGSQNPPILHLPRFDFHQQNAPRSIQLIQVISTSLTPCHHLSLAAVWPPSGHAVASLFLGLVPLGLLSQADSKADEC